MSPLARVADEQVGEIAVAVVEGEIDASNALAVGERLRASLTNQMIALVVVLDGTTYVDSAGINLLFDLGDELRQRRQRLHLVVAPVVAGRAPRGDHRTGRHGGRPPDA